MIFVSVVNVPSLPPTEQFFVLTIEIFQYVWQEVYPQLDHVSLLEWQKPLQNSFVFCHRGFHDNIFLSSADKMQIKQQFPDIENAQKV